jgi:hypothetical protein
MQGSDGRNSLPDMYITVCMAHVQCCMWACSGRACYLHPYLESRSVMDAPLAGTHARTHARTHERTRARADVEADADALAFAPRPTPTHVHGRPCTRTGRLWSLCEAPLGWLRSYHMEFLHRGRRSWTPVSCTITMPRVHSSNYMTPMSVGWGRGI